MFLKSIIKALSIKLYNHRRNVSGISEYLDRKHPTFVLTIIMQIYCNIICGLDNWLWRLSK